MKRETKSGIYCITCLVNGLKYVGQAKDIDKRKKEHFDDLLHGCHENRELQSDYDKYGYSNFRFEILEECEKDKLNHLEDYYILSKHAIKNGYNKKRGNVVSLSEDNFSDDKKSAYNSTFFINESSLLGNKVLFFVLSKMINSKITISEISVVSAEIRRILNVKGNGFYKTLKNVAEDLQTHRYIYFWNPIDNIFDPVKIIDICKYENGIFYIKFNNIISQCVDRLEDSIKNIDILKIINFNSIFSLRLYEIILTEICSNQNNTNDTDLFYKTYSISELRNLLILTKSAENKNNLYSDWRDFKKRVLDVAIQELNNKCNFYITYECLHYGGNSKITDLTLSIQMQNTIKSIKKTA